MEMVPRCLQPTLFCGVLLHLNIIGSQINHRQLFQYSPGENLFNFSFKLAFMAQMIVSFAADGYVTI